MLIGIICFAEDPLTVAGLPRMQPLRPLRWLTPWSRRQNTSDPDAPRPGRLEHAALAHLRPGEASARAFWRN
jgi:hypothetical protein